MDLILSLIVDGSAEGAQSAGLPLALRILPAAVVIVFFGSAAAIGAACTVYLALFLCQLARGLRE